MAVERPIIGTDLDDLRRDDSRGIPNSDVADAPVRPSLDQALAGLDALDRSGGSARATLAQRTWRSTWPKLIAFGLILLVWQIAVWAHWKPYVLQSPATAGRELWNQLGTSLFWQAVWVTAQQALIGYTLVVVIGGVVGTAVARIPVLRAGIGALITGMQTLPSVLWYPLAVMVFGVTWRAIILMMVLGAAPSVANGFISGIDQVPPGLLRAGRILGARGVSLERHVVLPAAFPSILGGLKQGWAFAWHALLAGEFLILVNPLSLGGRTVGAETQGTYGVVVAMMIVIVFIGIMVDVAFSRVTTSVRRRYGLIDASAG
ncbi:MAG: ABC transporter permease subunit [Acidimicrobiales bacterium]|nr:ABC transporter permease subunit [Acidimicrobiales bacterium]